MRTMRAMVIRVKSLPDGRRVARVQGDGWIGFVFLEDEMRAQTAEELEQIMQASLDAGEWDQNWAAALMAAAQHASVA